MPLDPDDRRFDVALRRHYPEYAAGGFTRDDGLVGFYSRVHALATGRGVVVDLGAGRGKYVEHPVPFVRQLVDLRAPERYVVGVDVDAAVRDNPLVDAAVVVGDDTLPIRSCSVDIVVASSVFEHVTTAEHLSLELHRVLRPGGWLCARTPNRWGYVGIGARTVQGRWRRRVLGRVQPGRPDADIFPTAYRMNSKRQLLHLFPTQSWSFHGYRTTHEPAYVPPYGPLWTAFRTGDRLLPEALRSHWCLFLQRR